MKQNKNLFFVILASLTLVAALLVAVPGSAIGDVGGYSGGSSYGGGGSSSSGGSSYSGSSSSSYYGGSSSSSDGEVGLGDVVITVVVLAVLLTVFLARSKRKKGAGGVADTGPQPAGATLTPDEQLSPVATILETDPDFDEAKMKSHISNLYVRMQNAWTAKDFTPMQPYFSDELYTQLDRQLDTMRKNRQTNYVNNIAVLGVDLRGWYEHEGDQCLVALVRTRIIDYTVDDKTGNVISPRPNDERFMTYEYTLVRTAGAVTPKQEGEVESLTCPHCGAPLNINQTSKCDYCGSVITAKDHDWVISIIKGISQQFGN